MHCSSCSVYIMLQIESLIRHEVRCYCVMALRSAVTNRLVVPSVRVSTVGSRAFPVAVPRNSLPEHVVTAATLQSFKKHLKTFLLQRSYSLAL